MARAKRTRKRDGQIMEQLLPMVKQNLIIDYDRDDGLLMDMLRAAVAYAEKRQNIAVGTYAELAAMPGATSRAVVMLASHWYESRDGSTGGFWGDKPGAADAVITAVDRMLDLDRRVAI